MQQLGDITKIDGHKVPLVDVICGGSPCQDLSVAGKRAGLTGERSGLFMEQIRIIKEMRDESIKQLRLRGTNEYIRPRYMVWENVPGAFSSNKGEDFRAVLEKTAKVAKGDACIPGPPNGKWPSAGCIMGDEWSIAWRVHDAQFWGVPQRRKRIALVADFGGESAPEILFERKSMSGDIETCGEEGEGVAKDARSGIEETGRSVVYGISAYNSNSMKSGNPNSGIYEAETARTLDLNGGSPACNQGGMAIVRLEGNGSRPSHRGDGYRASETMYTLNSTEHYAVAVENHPQDSRVKISEDGMVQTLSSRMGTGGGNVPMVLEPYTSSKASYHQHFTNDGKAETLVASDYKNPPTVTYGLDRAAYNQGMNAQYDFAVDEEKIGTQVAKDPGAVCTEGGQNETTTRNKILCILQETYGAETILKWGVAVLDTLQQADVLQQGVHEGGIQGKTKNREELDDSTLPCPSVVAEWLLRDMRQREECGCASQGWESTEQRFEQSDESMSELSQQNPQTCKGLFDMWQKGEGIGLLQQALYQIQKIRRSVDVPGAIVRRLTPLEAERLQGFPDHWTDIGDWVDSKGKKHKGESDSPRYKALGNSIALPFWEWMAKRMVDRLDADHPTMASLFDGIGGFPLAYNIAGCDPIWASEIEEFPIAVTKMRFPDKEAKE